MSHELLYTSAPKGLKSGSRGFCTVVCTQGMPVPLITALESLSAYRHVHPPGDRNAAKNPVAWSHLKMNVAGRAYHVLSRIADYGLDYSQRGNKLAHHLALETPEQTTGGPASLLEQSGNLETDWDGQPRLLPAGRRLRTGSRPPAVCTAWQAMTGDAGWAGVLAEGFLANPERQVYIVFEPGMDLLPLMAEALALLPAERRWEVTFSTYFTSLPPGVSCNWRCVLSGSPEAEQARKFGKALHIDLCHPVPPATGGSLVLAARTGRAAESATHPPHFATADADWTDDELASELELSPIDDEVPENSGAGSGVQFSESAPVPAAGTGYGVARPAGMPPPPPPPMPGRKRRTLADLNEADATRQSKRIRWVIASLAVMMIALGLAIWKAPWPPFASLRNQIVASQKQLDEEPQDLKVAGQLQRKAAADTALDDTKDGSKSTEKKDDQEEDKTAVKAAQKNSRTVPKQSSEVVENEKLAEIPREAAEKKRREGELAAKQTAITRPRPQFGQVPLPSIPIREKQDKAYEQFAISLQDAIKNKTPIRLPGMDARTIKLGLHSAKGMSSITAKPKPGDDSEITILKKTPFGDSARVLSIIAKRGDDGDCEVRFVNEEAGWEILKWCLLSVEEADHTLHLFSLQLPTLEWINPQFKDSDFPLRLDGLGDWASPKSIRIETVDLGVTGFGPLHFSRDGENPKPLLLCELSITDAEKILISARPQLKLDLSPTRPKESDGLMLTSLPYVAPMHDCVKNRLKEELMPFANWYDYAKSASITENLMADLLSENAGKSSKSAFAIAAGKIKSNSEELQTQIDDAKRNKNEQQVAILTRKREESEANRQKLDHLKDASESYRNFKSAFKKAEIMSLSLCYDFELSNPDDPKARKMQVPVTLIYKTPGE